MQMEVHGAISSALDSMEVVIPSLCSLQSKIDAMNLLASQLSSLSAKECALLDEYEDFLGNRGFGEYALSRIRKAVRNMLTLDEIDPCRTFEGQIQNIYRLLGENENNLDYVLALAIENFLKRRL